LSRLVDHARRELDLCGQTAKDPAYAASLVAAVAAFASYGHSGGSASCAIAQLHELLQFHALSPLTADPDEWIDQSVKSGYPMWQNVRNPSAFSKDGGQTHYLLDDQDTIITSAPARPSPLPDPIPTDPEDIASRLEYKADQALKAQPAAGWTNDEKSDFHRRQHGRATAFTEAARIVRGES
jgi:hypothetical protein